MERARAMLEQLEEFPDWMGEHVGLDDEGVSFHEKKHQTSFMRRFAPERWPPIFWSPPIFVRCGTSSSCISVHIYAQIGASPWAPRKKSGG